MGPIPSPLGRPLHHPGPTWSSRGCLVLALHCRVPSASKREAQTPGVGQSYPLHGGFRVGRGVGPTFFLKLTTNCWVKPSHNPGRVNQTEAGGQQRAPELRAPSFQGAHRPWTPLPREPRPPSQGAWDGASSSARIRPSRATEHLSGSLGLQGRAAVTPGNPNSALPAAGPGVLSPPSLVPICKTGTGFTVRRQKALRPGGAENPPGFWSWRPGHERVGAPRRTQQGRRAGGKV